jgi:uncharacterized protein (TIGR03000 family)
MTKFHLVGKTLTVGAAVIASFAVASTAKADWGSWGSRGGSWGGGSVGGSSGGSWGGHRWGSSGGSSGGYVGPIRRLFQHVRAHHSHGSWGSRGYASSGYSRGYGSTGYASTGYASSGGYYASNGASYGSTGYRGYYVGETQGIPQPYVIQTVPGGYAPVNVVPAPQGTPPAPQPTPSDAGGAGDATLNVRVPAQARVFVNDRLTRTPGELRQYISRNLKPGRSYTYEIRAELERDGQTLTQTQVVSLQAGADKMIDISFDEEPTVTSLSLVVPPDARVTLGGVESSATGPVRFFSTRELAKGNVWRGYEISVSVERNGQTLTEQRTIDIVAGESHDVTIDFDTDERVAAR